MTGTIVRGDGRGRELGFPTANLQLEQKAARPADGIYAVWAKLDGQIHPAVAHVGPRPTFPGSLPTIEVHILDFPDRDLYGQKLNLRFVKKLRSIDRFSTVKKLAQAIQQDCVTARRVLQGADVFRHR